MEHKTEEAHPETIHNLIKDPYIFEFLGLSPDVKNLEKSINLHNEN